jgi:hypothetical protein
MSDDISNPIVQLAIREAQKAIGTFEEFGILGNASGQLSAGKNRVWVRKVLSDGSYSRAYRAIAHSHKSGSYLMYLGSPVVLGYIDNELTVLGQNHRATEQIGINPAVLNTGDPSVQATPSTTILPLLAHAVGTLATPSTKIGIKSFRYFDTENQVGWYQGSVATQVDLASSIPSAGLQRYAVVFFNTTDQTFTVKTSSSQVLAIPLDDTDKQECFDGMPPYSIPVCMWRLADAQTAITQADFVEDLRPMFGQGTTRHNYSATSAPAITDDSDSGYGVGSVWVNVLDDEGYICVDNTVGNAIWVMIGGQSDNFYVIEIDTPKTIPNNRQIVLSHVMIITGGSLTVDGVVVFVGEE